MEEGKNCFVYGTGSAPKSEVSLDTIKKCAQNLSKYKDIDGLRYLCNILFSGPYRAFLRNRHSPSIEELVHKIYESNPKRPPEWGDFAEIILKVTVAWRTNYKISTAASGNDVKTTTVSSEILEYFSQNGDQEIEISHGGGYENICDFLNGKCLGYPLEDGGLGLQVSPKVKYQNEDIDYTHRSSESALRSIPQFDIPAIFTATIQLKYLLPAPNAYEAGLPQRAIKHLKNVKLTPISVVWEDAKISPSQFTPFTKIKKLKN